MKITALSILFSLASLNAMAASYETLPMGIDMLALKHVSASRIESKYDANGQDSTLDINENFTPHKLENISSAFKTYFEQLKSISPAAYEQFSLGEFEADAYADVNSQGLGFAHGLTDRLTVYASIPVYHIKTNVAFKQSKKSSISAIQSTIANAPTTSAVSNFVKQLTMQLPETNEELLQSLVVNYYGYKPLGSWEKDALGDAEIGMLYRFTNFYDRGFSMAIGAVVPTGDADDPDSLQDVPTGDGQYDAFIETNAGMGFFNNSIALDLKTRYTYQFATNKTLRTIESKEMPLSKNKEEMKEKLGNKIDSTISLTYNPTPWLNMHSAFLLNVTEKSRYSASNPAVKSIMEENSNSNNQWARIGIGFSSVELYKSRKMDIPFEINLSAQKLLNAKNTASYDRIDLDFRLYF